MINRVILGDCMDFMATCKDNEFDLGIVDPPYGIGAGGGIGGDKLATVKRYKNGEWDNSIPDKKYFDELFRITKNQIIWGGNYFLNYLNNTPCMIVWDKKNGMNNFADCELAWTSFKTAVRKYEFMWQGMLQGNMKNKEERIHATQKPVALYKWLLTNYATLGQTIFDSHVGSGSSRIACHDLGYDFTGCELDADYHAVQEERYKRYVAQRPLFEPKELRQPEQVDLFKDESCN